MCQLNIKDYYNLLLDKGIEISGKHFNEKILKKTSIYTEWNNSNSKNEFVYNILFDIDEIPSCKICGKQVKLKSFKYGYREYCSNKCVAEANKQSSTFSKKISDGMKSKYDTLYYLDKYKYVKHKEGENFLISGYCKHGDFYINKNKFMRILKDNGEICEKCIEENISACNEVVSNKYLTEQSFKSRHPKEWNIIVENCKEIDASFSEKRYMYKNEMQERPICPICKSKKTKYIGSYSGYTKTCASNSCILSSSAMEQTILDFVKKYYPNAESRVKLYGHEVDIYMEGLKLGIEFNGLYWHSTKFKDKEYHQKKKLELLKNGITLIHVWEDDWLFKRDIVESIILNNLKQNNIKIYARECEIKEVDSFHASNFINDNHIQGKCKGSINIGLFYMNELVSLMTFSNGRMIMKNTNKGLELLRFCNKKTYTVVGGASKLFSYFVKKYKPDTVISYANLDISNGNIYRVLGFVETSITPPGYWWCKDNKKYNRSNFMKHKIAITEDDKKKTENQIMTERGYYKIWNSGNIKFTWTK